jgi:phosphoglycolate phosphatase
MKIILFDIDGTLVDVGDASKRAFNKAFFEKFNTEPVRDGVRVHGSTDPVIRKNLMLKTFGRDFKDSEYEDLNNRYVELLEQEVLVEEKYLVLPGVSELLEILSKREDVAIGLQTGNIEPAVKHKLGRGQLNKYFYFGGFGSDHEERSEIIKVALERAKWLLDEDFNINDVYIVGDTPFDVEAGKVAGVKTIAVTTGIFSHDELSVSKPDFIFNDLSDRERILQCFGFLS